MEFIEKVIGYFTHYDLAQLPADILRGVALLLMLSFVLAYSSNHHSGWYTGIITLVLVFIVTLTVLGAIKSNIVIYIVLVTVIITTVVLFSAEIRRDLYKLSIKPQGYNSEESVNLTPEELSPIIASIVKSCQSLSKSDTGALIVICQSQLSDYVTESGTMINANLTSELIETVFYPKSPLHDGAMLVIGNKIMSAGCYLPLTQKPNLPKELGTRHRAAIGITENDPTVTAIVVSEETGIISVMHDGMYKRYMDAESLNQALEYAYNFASGKEFWK
ncbi:MAG: DNA integrity scanning protein DisA nucleotide-binding domain protein [Clostridia bacterium]